MLIPKNYVLYHEADMDGRAAAWVVWRFLGGNIELIPVSYQQPVPTMEDDSHVYIVDFSLPREELEALHERMFSIILIDHHETAEEQLKDLSYCYFNSSESAATLAWKLLFPGKPMPTILRYVRDRDLWEWQLKDSREINTALYLLTKDTAGFPVMDFFSTVIEDPERSPRDYFRLISLGEGAELIKKQAVLRGAKNTQWTRLPGADRSRWIPVVCGSDFPSEMCEHLMQINNSSGACVYWINGRGEYKYSLRSNGSWHAGKLAKRWGGGGHEKAAGFGTKKQVFELVKRW